MGFDVDVTNMGLAKVRISLEAKNGDREYNDATKAVKDHNYEACGIEIGSR